MEGRMEGAEREGEQEVLERQETKSARWWVGGNRGRKFVVTLSRRGFSRVFEPRTSLIRYLKIPTYFDPFVAECAVDLERIRRRFIIFIIPEEEYYLSVGMVVLFNIFDIFSLSILYYVIYPNDQLLYTFFVLFTYLTENNRNVKFKKCEMNVDSLRVS